MDSSKHPGDMSDLEQAISRLREAVNLTPDGHPNKPIFLNNLANSFLTRFRFLGELSDLEQAISTHLDATHRISDGHLHKPICLHNLADSLLSRFERFGDPNDLEQAISTHKDTVDLTPYSHPDRPTYLGSLGDALMTRFKRFGELSDLEQAISSFKDAIDLSADGHLDKPNHLINLGKSFLSRFERLGESSDLEGAISSYRDAVDLTPDGHPHKPDYLDNLANAFRIRFKRLGELRDLEAAVDLFPDSHPGKPGSLSDLGNSFFTRFERLGELSDLDQAIFRHRHAVDLTPDGHPGKPSRLHNLGNTFRTRFERLGEPSDLEQAISLYSGAARALTGPSVIRFEAAKQWILSAHTLRHHSLLQAYSIAIALLPQLAWIGLSLANRYHDLMRVGAAEVVQEGAAAALDSGRPETAVEWLEQGRSIVWGDLFHLRSSYEELSSVHPDHARRLRELSAALEHANAAHEKSLCSLSGRTQSIDHGTLGQEADGHRQLAIKRDKLLQEIRGLPGFERFLLRKEFSQLRASAHSGPVVILNAAKTRCDALVVHAGAGVIHVPLPHFTLARSNDLQNEVMNLFDPLRGMYSGEGNGTREHDTVESILAPLWNGVVKPVLDALTFSTSTSGDLPRVFWCPTGPFTFLPIHAAGLYGTQSSESGDKVSDFVVSSYTPALSFLAQSLKPDSASSGDLNFLVVGQPPSDGALRLPGVVAELEYIKAVIQDSPSRITLIEPSIGTVEEVVTLMKEADWVHFACLAVQDKRSPADIGLLLADGRRLKLSDIIALSRPRGGLAFLSPLETARGDEDLPDEAIHLAAGMLFAGYGGAIATMWSINDKLAPVVAKDVYEQLFRNSTRSDRREAARALQGAVGRLRDRGASFREWVPFIHIGL